MHDNDIIECIRAAHNKLIAAENQFMFATENDVQVAVAELNAAKAHLNRLYEIAKQKGVTAEFEIYKSNITNR